jgi:hypothetical protein
MPSLGLSLETSCPSPASFQAQQAQVQGIVASSAEAQNLLINGSNFYRTEDYEGVTYWYGNNFNYLFFFSGSWHLITNEEYFEEVYVWYLSSSRTETLDSNSYSSSALIPTSNWTSNATIITVIAPSAPAFTSVNTNLVNDLPSINVTWSAPTTGTPPFTYTISRRLFPSGTFQTLNNLTSTSASFSDLFAGYSYSLSLRASNSAGNSSSVALSQSTPALSYISTNAARFAFNSSPAFSVTANVTGTFDGTVNAEIGSNFPLSTRIASNNSGAFYAYGRPNQLPFDIPYVVEAVYNSSSTKWNIRFVCMDENEDLTRFVVFAESTASQISTRIPKTGWSFITGNVTSSSGEITLDHYHP